MPERPVPKPRLRAGHRIKLLTDFAALSGGQLVSKVVAFVTFAYLARALEPETYGSLEFAVGIVVFCSSIIDFGLGPAGVRRISRNPECMPALAAQIPAARLLIALIIVPLISISAPFLGVNGDTSALIGLFAIGLLAAPWQQQWLLQGLEMMRLASAAQVVRTFVFAGAVFLLVKEPGHVLRVGYIEILAAASCAAYYLVIQQFRITPVRLRCSRGALKSLMREGLPLGLSSMVWAFIQYAPLFLIATLAGTRETAWFGASHRVVVSLLIFSYIYHFNLYPTLTKRMQDSPDELTKLVRASFRVTAWLGILIGLCLTLLAAPLLSIAFGQRFATAGPAFSILVWVVPVTILSGHARWTLIAAGRQKLVLFSHIAGAAAMILCGPPLVILFASAGASAAMLVGALTVWGAAHIYAGSRGNRVPGLLSLPLPAGLAVLAGVAAPFLSSSPWLNAAAACAFYIILAPILDRALLSDFRKLAQAKSSDESPD